MSPPYLLLSVIIPVYNEKSTIGEVIEKVSAVELSVEKEIIVVDDGSTDGTIEAIHPSRAKIRHTYMSPVNIGKGAAVRIGLTLARGDLILIQDADLELDPGELRKLIQPILDGNTMVTYGSRFLQKNSVPLTRRLGNYILTAQTNLLFGTRLTDMATAYKVFTSEIAKELVLAANRFEIDAEITAQIASRGYKILEVPVTYRPRTQLEGKKIKWRDGIKVVWTLFKHRFLI
ncbi:MAG: glycosyltransferase family 2 protein [Pyrinomonadaceae bacterium]